MSKFFKVFKYFFDVREINADFVKWIILFLCLCMYQIYVLYEKYVWRFSLFTKNENCGDVMFYFVSLNEWNKMFDFNFYNYC